MALGKVISDVMQKGGVGKTTTTKNLIEELGRKYKVLGIDNDAQADCTDTFMSKKVVELSGQKTTYDIYMNDASIDDVKVKISENIDFVPSNILLANVDVELSSKLSREFVLKKAIDKVKDQYDFIVIDCAPSLSIATINALVASDAAVYVTQVEYFSMQAIGQLQNTVNMVKEINQNLKVLGLLLTMVDETNHVKDVIEELTDTNYEVLGEIDRRTAVRDSIVAKKAMFQYDPTHP